MAEMNGRVNHSKCIPPPALCLQIPSLQACTEGLPLVLQRPDNFPLVMGILQEINQEKVGFSRCAGTHQRPLSISEVKQENADVEEHQQTSNSELCQEWSLKGVEELLTEPEELQLRQDYSQQPNDPGVSHLEVCESDEKPSVALQSVQPHYGSEQAQLHVDEPLIQLQITSPLEQQVLFQENALLHVNEKPITIEVFSAQRSEVDVNSKSQHAVPLPIQVHVEDKVGLHSIRAVKREPEEVEAQAPTLNKPAESFEEQKGSIGCLDACQSVDKKSSIRLDHDEKFSLSGHKSQLERVQSSEPELNLLMQKRRLSMDNVQSGCRNTSAVLALPADFSELEQSHPGKGYSQISPSVSLSLVAEGSICSSVSSKKGQILAEERKLQSVIPVAEPDCCELTLSLASSKPQVPIPSLDGDADKPVVKPFTGQEKHDGQCQRTSPYQWQQAIERYVSYEYHGHTGQDTVPAGMKKQLFPATDGCCGKGENPLEHLGSIEHCNFFPRAKNSQDTVPQPDAGQLFPATSNCKTESDFSRDEKGSRKTLQSISQTIDEGVSPEERESQDFVSDGGEPNSPPMAIESSQAEVAPQLTEPQRKKMRGTLPLDEKGDVFSKEEKDTRCHRSDGKSWRCVRECINGAYYCQYHLRKRRIGYNRRKNREVNPDDLEAVSKESLKLNKQSR